MEFEQQWNCPYALKIEFSFITTESTQANSINLMAIAGPDYECLYAKIGSNCMVNDGGVWSKIRLFQPVDGSVKLPIHDKLPERERERSSNINCFSSENLQ